MMLPHVLCHDDVGDGSMQLAHIGDGFSVESPSPNYMETLRPPSTGWNQQLKQQQHHQAHLLHQRSHSTARPEHGISNIINRSRDAKAISATTT